MIRFPIWSDSTSIILDIYQVQYMQYFLKDKKNLSKAVKYRTTWDQLVAYYINIEG